MLRLSQAAFAGAAGVLAYIAVNEAPQFWPMREGAPLAVTLPQTIAPQAISPPVIAAPRTAAAPEAVATRVLIPPVPPRLVGGVPLVGTPTVMPAVVHSGAAGGQIAIPVPADRAPRMPAVPIPAVFRVPPGRGPFPAVIYLHGCNGVTADIPAWAVRLNNWGYAALMPDSMTPRGIASVCDPAEQPKITAWDRVGDVGAAAAWLRTRPEIDPTRIAVLGASHGGATAAVATLQPYAGYGLRAAIDYYGPCLDVSLRGQVPLLALAGEADDWGDPAKWCRMYGQVPRPEQVFELHTYPGVYHAFDAVGLPRTVMLGHTLGYDQAAADDSFARVHAFLERFVRR